MSVPSTSTIVVGGGFYGCCLALLCKAAGHSVIVVEAEEDLLCRASYANQARVHYGYHYPRSFLTAVRSALNFPRFVHDFRPAIVDGFTKLYAVSRRGSKVTADQFYRLARKIGAPIRVAPKNHGAMFDTELIEQVFSVTEYAFDAAIIRRILREKLADAAIPIHFSNAATSISQTASGGLAVKTQDGVSQQADHVFVANYSGINTLLRNSGLPELPMKHELTEIALIRHPSPLDQMGVTVMDGPFFSTMPFPDRKAHSFTHVRYTPHRSWIDAEVPQDPYEVLRNGDPVSTHALMLKDAQRYLPKLSEAVYVDSLYEIKTVLIQNEGNDGRPILLRRDYEGVKGLSVVMGGKIDNVYDILGALGDLRCVAENRGPSWITRLLGGD